jgi:signal transduction histidine kinase
MRESRQSSPLRISLAGKSRTGSLATGLALTGLILPLATSRGIDVSSDIETGAVVEGDEQQLERLFLNLLSNAVKFSHANNTIEVVGKSTDTLTITVTDRGIGIPEGEQDQLFTRFFRSRSAGERQIQGTGLGLSIVANIVQAHGGEVTVESTENVGTTVKVTLPMLSVTKPSKQGELV